MPKEKQNISQNLVNSEKVLTMHLNFQLNLDISMNGICHNTVVIVMIDQQRQTVRLVDSSQILKHQPSIDSADYRVGPRSSVMPFSAERC